MAGLLDERVGDHLRVLCFEGAQRAGWPVDRDGEPGDVFVEVIHDERGSSLVHIKAAERRRMAALIAPPADVGAIATAPLERAELKAQELGRKIAYALPPGWGFVLALASFGEEHRRMTFVSSVKREGAIELLRELADKVERREPTL